MGRVNVYRTLGDTNYGPKDKKTLDSIITKLAFTSGFLKFARPFIFTPKEFTLIINEFSELYVFETLETENKIRRTVLKILSFILAGVVMFSGVYIFFSKKSNKENAPTSDSSIIHNDYNRDTYKKTETDSSDIELFDIFMNEDVKKVRDAAIDTLISFGLISKDGTLNCSVNDFKKLGMSLRDKDDLFAITHIYVFELAVEKYDPNAIDDYYRGIKCKVNGENRCFTGKEDFLNVIGKSRSEYEKWIKNNIINREGDIWNYYSCNSNTSNNNPRLSDPYTFNHNDEDRGMSFVDILNAMKREKADNMKRAALGPYKAKRLHY